MRETPARRGVMPRPWSYRREGGVMRRDSG